MTPAERADMVAQISEAIAQVRRIHDEITRELDVVERPQLRVIVSPGPVRTSKRRGRLHLVRGEAA